MATSQFFIPLRILGKFVLIIEQQQKGSKTGVKIATLQAYARKLYTCNFTFWHTGTAERAKHQKQ